MKSRADKEIDMKKAIAVCITLVAIGAFFAGFICGYVFWFRGM